MNKQEVIDKQALIDELMKIPGVGSNSDALKTIKRFPSYEPQKPVVPAFVAEWIELCKEKADLSSCLNGYYEIGDGTIVRPRGFSEEFYDWLSDYDHMHDLARAYLDGYEVEEEPKWIVKYIPPFIDDFRYYSMDDEIFDITESLWTSDKEDAYPFTEKEKAEAVALLVDGSVEEV